MARRRSNGEGSFRQMKPGLWQGRIEIVDPITGERVRKSRYGATRTEAKMKLDELRRRTNQGLPSEDSVDTLEQWCQRWIATVLPATKLRESTQGSYISVVRRHIMPTRLGGMSLSKIRPSDIDLWIVGMQDDEKSSSTTRRHYNVLARVLEAAVRDGLLADNPIRHVDRPAAQRSTPTVLTPAEVRAILDASHGHWMFPLIQFLAVTGVRRGEALGLKWDAVDLTTGKVEIRTSLGRTNKGMALTEVKTGTSRRTLLLPPEVCATLKDLRRAQQVVRERAAVWHDENIVFSRPNGRPLSADTATRHFQQLCRKAGVTRTVGFHAVRHEAATAMLDAGVNPKVVAEWFGHSSTRTTLDIYAHTTEATQLLAAGALWANVIDATARFEERGQAAG